MGEATSPVNCCASTQDAYPGQDRPVIALRDGSTPLPRSYISNVSVLETTSVTLPAAVRNVARDCPALEVLPGTSSLSTGGLSVTSSNRVQVHPSTAHAA